VPGLLFWEFVGHLKVALIEIDTRKRSKKEKEKGANSHGYQQQTNQTKHTNSRRRTKEDALALLPER
jgi:hypothetical protein